MAAPKIADLPLIWPDPLGRASRPAVVYLDQNHFVNLAKHAHGDPKFRHYASLLSAVLRASADRRVVFPLSTVHFMETEHITNPRRRRDLANLMEEISGFTTILGRPFVARLEIQAAVLNCLGVGQATNKVPLLGYGILHAVGRPAGIPILDNHGVDISAVMRDEVGHEEFDREMAQGVLNLNRTALAGPLPHEINDLRARGYAPEGAREDSESRLAFETDFALMLQGPNGGASRANLRDAVSVRELIHEWNAALDEQLQSVGASIADVMPNKEGARAFTESMPSTRVAISIKTQYHRNPQRPWTSNDVFDIDALSVAVAYCDAVLSDKQAWNAVRSGRELEPMGSFFPRGPEELADWIDRHA